MQEGMLHLGQNLAEELEHLLPHAWRVLRVRGECLSVRRRGHAPARTAPPFTARRGLLRQPLSLTLGNRPPLRCQARFLLFSFLAAHAGS